MTCCPCACHAEPPGDWACSRMASLGGCADRARPTELVRQDDTEPDRTNGPTYRCRRDWRCYGRTPLRDEQTNELLGWEPAMPARGRDDGLCVTCEGRVHAALVAFPALLADLDALVGRDATSTPPSDAPTSRSKELPIPLRVEVDAVRGWIAHLAATWAPRLGAAMDTELLEHDLGDQWWTTIGPRPQLPWADLAPMRRNSTGEQLAWLRTHTTLLLQLPPGPTPVWSAGEHPADGLDDDTVTVTPGRGGTGQMFWADQDGTDAGIALIAAHTRAQRAARTTLPRETTSVGCTRCGWPVMHRDAGDSAYRCPRCGWTRPEAHHDVVLEHLLRSRPETAPVAKARIRKERADSAARAARLAAGRHQHRR